MIIKVWRLLHSVFLIEAEQNGRIIYGRYRFVRTVNLELKMHVIDTGAKLLGATAFTRIRCTRCP